MIGQPCANFISAGADVTVASLDDASRSPEGTKHLKLDLRSFQNCLDASKDAEIVFHLAGVKGSPQMTKTRPASFMVPTIQFSLNMMEAAEGIRLIIFYLLVASEFTNQLKNFMRTPYGKLSQVLMINLLVGQRGYVNFKLRLTGLNMDGTIFQL